MLALSVYIQEESNILNSDDSKFRIPVMQCNN